MVPTTAWLPGREKFHWLIWGSTISVILMLGHFWPLAIALLCFYVYKDYSEDKNRFFNNAELYLLIASGIILARVWQMPSMGLLSVTAVAFVAHVTSKMPTADKLLAETFFDARTMRYCCLLIFLAVVSKTVSFNPGFFELPFSAWHAHVSTVNVVSAVVVAAFGMMVSFASTVCLRQIMVQKESPRFKRLLKTIWHDYAFYLFVVAQLVILVIATCAPGSPGEWFVGWLVSSNRDANIDWMPTWQSALLQVRNIDLQIVPGLERIVVPAQPNVGVCIKTIVTMVIGLVCLPRMMTLSVFLTSVARRLRPALDLQSLVEDFLEVLRQPTSKLRIKEAVPWLHNASATFYWFLFCYSLLFWMVAFLPGSLGEAIRGWLEFSSTDAGFAPHAVRDFPQLKFFLASIVAMMGAVPLAVTGCAFLPSLRSKVLSITPDGILLSQGPYLSLLFRPYRAWFDLKSVKIKGRKGETRPNRRTLVISFFSGGNLKLKLHQLSEKDFYDLFSAIDEYADECFIDPEVLELRSSLAVVNGAKVLPEGGQLRALSADNFRSTVFVPFGIGETIPETSMRVVRQLATKQLSAVYLVRLGDGRLAIAKQFSFPENCLEAERMRKDFLREYELLRGLKHARTAKVIECFEQGNSSFLVLEYAKGRDLRDIVERDGARSEQSVLEIASQICDVLIYLHTQTPVVLHRDLTPDNLVIDDERDLKLIDFGAAHQFLEGITGTLIGKQCYVAPEQLRGEPSIQSDIYSFGCTLYFLLTGEDPLALSRCDPSEKSPTSESLTKLVKRCTEFEAINRPQSFSEIHKLLDDIRAGRTNSLDNEVIADDDLGFRISLSNETLMVPTSSKRDLL
jgi:hypothetical protein